MTNLQTNWKDNFLSYIFIIISIVLVSFVIYPFFNDIISLEDENEMNTIKIEDLKTEKEKLESIKDLLDKDEDTKNIISKYLNSTDENKILDFFYNYSDNADNWIIIKNLSITKWVVWLKWFNEAKVILALKVSSEKKLLEFIDFLRSDSSEYKIFINELNYKIWSNESFEIDLPLNVYYK